MNTVALNPEARKAVLIMESDDGTIVAMTIYKPRFKREFHDQHLEGMVRVIPGTNTMTFETSAAFSTTHSEASLKHAASVYAEARKEALLSEMSDVSIMPSGEDLMALNFRTHEAAMEAVYLAGISAGAEQVKFNDAYFEKQLAEAPVKALDRAYSEIAMAHASAESRGKPWAKGLKRAMRTVTEIRHLFAEKVPS